MYLGAPSSKVTNHPSSKGWQRVGSKIAVETNGFCVGSAARIMLQTRQLGACGLGKRQGVRSFCAGLRLRELDGVSLTLMMVNVSVDLVIFRCQVDVARDGGKYFEDADSRLNLT